MGDWRVGVDVGGSFTDLVAFNTRSRELRVHKVPTVKADPPSGVLHALARLSGDGVELGDVDAFLHGTTIGTNALLEMTGAKVGMLVTEGFTAVPQVQAGSQPRPFLLFYHRPEHLVHPTLVRGVGERVSSAGAELAPLDVPATRQAVRDLRDAGAESIAVCFMFSYADPSHEREAKAVIQEEFPGCAVSLSSDIMPRIREWQRMSTTLVNAYLEPVLASYLGRLDDRLASCGVTTPQRFLMQSNGGVMPFTAAVRGGQTHHTLLSGPAAGAMSAAFLCATQGLGNIVSLDIGGTSADVAFIEGGAPGEVTQGVIEGRAIYSPMVDIEAVSAGGGTIAQVDRGGLLRVGPQSAGSDPGPACYGRGGREATITDADVTLGYLAPDYFLGGDMPLDAAAAERVLLDRIGRPLGLSAQEAAWGIVRVLEVKMADRISALAAERGAALLEFALVAGGGAGPLHAAGVAEEIGIRRIIVPPRPGAFSALGLLCSDIVHDYVWTTVSELATTPLEQLNGEYERLEERARADLASEGIDPARATLIREADVRYAGQGFELRTPVKRGAFSEAERRALRNRFERRHKRLYGHASPGQAVEIVSFRLRVVVPVRKFEAGEDAETPAVASTPKPAGSKPRWFGAGLVESAHYWRDALAVGAAFSGPAVVYQADSTTVVPPGWRLSVDGYRNLVLERSVA